MAAKRRKKSNPLPIKKIGLVLLILPGMYLPAFTQNIETLPYKSEFNAQLSFTNIADSLHVTGIGSHGIFFTDFNNDGTPDLYITRLWIDPLTDLLFRNGLWDKTLAEEGAIRGVDDPDGGSHGACFADIDNDGDYDLINGTTYTSGRTGPDHNNIFLNDGYGFFTDITHLSTDILATKRETRAVVTFDMDRDGDLDIFSVTGYLGTDDTSSGSNEVYINDGHAIFTRSSNPILENTRAGQGATDTDFDGDGDIDLIVANRTGNLVIFRNDNFGKFSLIPPETIMDIPNRAGDGITMADIDNDGDLDMLLVSEGPPSIAHLYRNTGNGYFTLLKTWTDVEGYMGGFADLDNDSDLDMIFAGDSICYLNDGLGNYTAGPSLNRPVIRDPRAIAFADIDNDGDMDIAVADRDTNSFLIRNDLSIGTNWLKIKLVSPQGQAGAFGSKISIFPAFHLGSNLICFKEARSNIGYLAQNDPVLHFGLGNYTAIDIQIEFPDGTIAQRQNVKSKQTSLIEGADVLFRTKVFLQGPFNTENNHMSTSLALQGLIPLRSPYYQDPCHAAYIPFDVVDWILIEFAESPQGPILASKSALLYDNGKVKDSSGRELIPLKLPAGNYFITISHRNHLKVTSSLAISLHYNFASSFDFTSGESQLLQPRSCVEMKPWIWAAAGGNTDNTDGDIFSSDLAGIRSAIGIGAAGYHLADTNLDGIISEMDYDLCRLNMLLGLYDRIIIQ